MNEFKLTGGARVGNANATFPFATLKVSKDRMEINASIISHLTFKPSDVISIEPYTMVPIIGQGIKINHKVSTYQDHVIFWTFKDPNSVFLQIQETGFLSNENSSIEQIDRMIKDKQAQGGNPIKKSFAVGAVISWNILFLMDILRFFYEDREGFPIGNGALTAIGLLFLTALLSLVSTDFRRFILKEGRGLNDIKKIAIFIMIISGFMLLNFRLLTRIFE
ncbi:MAG: hypothetical protein CL605_08635 [Altibacter sp.]|nr:hypothetical protein [Altibacter sp.]MAP54952.1 hypothetical protein [Altibacter sp.]